MDEFEHGVGQQREAKVERPAVIWARLILGLSFISAVLLAGLDTPHLRLSLALLRISCALSGSFFIFESGRAYGARRAGIAEHKD